MSFYRCNKLGNEYINVLGADLYERTPKAVLAAVLVSFVALSGESADDFDPVRRKVLEEWGALHRAGIVPQKPPTVGRHQWLG